MLESRRLIKYFLILIVGSIFLNISSAQANSWPFGNAVPAQPPAGTSTPAPEKEHFIMPDTLNRPLEEVKESLKQACGGFLNRTLIANPVTSGKAPDGYVFEISPAPGEKVYTDSVIRIKYAKNQLTPEKFNALKQIPNVIGMTVEEATKVLNAAGWESYTPAGFATHKIGIEYQTSDPTNSFKNGMVMGASHSYDGWAVVLTVLKKESIAMPYVIGKSYAEAEKILQDTGLFKEVKREEVVYTDNFLKQNPARKSELKTIVKQSPNAGTLINPEQEYIAWISEGVSEADREITVPNISMMTEESAVALLKSNGLIPKIIYSQSTNPVLGGHTSVKCDPPMGSKVKAGTEVSFTVYRLKAKVPFLFNSTKEEAIKLLEDNGLKCEFVDESTYNSFRDGKVKESDPPKYSIVDPGTVVKVIIYKQDKVKVPNLVGMSKSSAEAYLKKNKPGLKYKFVNDRSTVYTTKADQIYRISPEYQTVVNVGDTVTIYTYKILESVPDVIGKTEAVAVSELEAAEFFVRIIYEEIWDESQKIGTVIKQGQKAGQPPTGLSVFIYVAREPDQVKIPDVIGKSFESAEWTLRLADSDFKAVRQTVNVFDRKKHGRVTSISPGTGTKVKPGSQVTVYVGKLVEYVPDVVGLTETDAKRKLSAEGFYSITLYTEKGSPGKVVNQSPDANSTPADGRVRIYLTKPDVKFNQPTQRETDYIVPYVKTLTVNEARLRLAERNLNYRINYIPAGRDRHGRILGTSPPAGAKLKPEWKQDVLLNVGWYPYLVPNVVGMTRNQAIEVIENNRMRPRIIEDRPPPNWDRRRQPIVLNQEPHAGAPKQGIYINLRLIYEPEIPRIIGKGLHEAIPALQDRGLKYTIEFVPVAQGKDDRIIRNAAPAPGSRVPLGTTITLKVGKISDTVPDVMGKPEQEAVSILENFRIHVMKEYKDPDTANNVVLAQSLIPGTTRQGSMTILLGQPASLAAITVPTPAVKKPSILASLKAPSAPAAAMAPEKQLGAGAPAPQQAPVVVPAPAQNVSLRLAEPDPAALQQIREFYSRFKDAYESKDEYAVTGLISGEWASGDGNGISELEENLHNMFNMFDEIQYQLTGLMITAAGGNTFKTSYTVTIQGTIFDSGITHKETSSVEELLGLENGKVTIIKTLNGNFWSVN